VALCGYTLVISRGVNSKLLFDCRSVVSDFCSRFRALVAPESPSARLKATVGSGVYVIWKQKFPQQSTSITVAGQRIPHCLRFLPFGSVSLEDDRFPLSLGYFTITVNTDALGNFEATLVKQNVDASNTLIPIRPLA
jgi:hypothetical protein